MSSRSLLRSLALPLAMSSALHTGPQSPKKKLPNSAFGGANNARANAAEVPTSAPEIHAAPGTTLRPWWGPAAPTDADSSFASAVRTGDKRSLSTKVNGGRETTEFEKRALEQVNKWWEPLVDALPGSKMDMGEELWADEYWNDPRIHSFGNVGAGGMFHAMVAPIFTKGLDMFAYDDTDLRMLAALNIATRRAEQGLTTERVVDIGCGTGASSRSLRAVWPEARVVALDTSAEMLKVARTLGHADNRIKEGSPIEFVQGNAEYTGLRSHDFDVVSVMFLMHEAPQAGRKSILAEAQRLLKPGGTLVICDIAREYTPSATMKSGEPYIDGYLANVEEDILSAGFKSVSVSQPIPGRAEMWECRVPTLEEQEQLLNQERLRRVSKPMVNALGVSFQLSMLMAVADIIDVASAIPDEIMTSAFMLP